MRETRYRRWLRHVRSDRTHILGLRLTTTWRCDSKCSTCHIWESKDNGKNDLTVDEYDRLSRSKHFRRVQYITLSGGEPVLRNDLPDVIGVLHRNIPTAVLSMTTNGLNPERTEKHFRRIVKENPKLRLNLVGLSLNGPEEVHDRTRGVPGSYRKVLETYDRIRDLAPCRFSFTFCADNVEHWEWVQKFAEEKGTSAYICWTVMNERFKVAEKDLLFWQPGMDRVLGRFVDKTYKHDKARTSILKNLVRQPPAIQMSYLYDNIVNRKVMPCYAGSQIVHIAPDGSVYPCNFKLTDDRLLGNIRDKSFDEIWANVPPRILREIRAGECMYPNGLCGDSDIFPSACNNPPAIMRWYARKVVTRRPLIEKTQP